ncbi:MAG: acetyltransferase [Anaerovibrio sp.]
MIGSGGHAKVLIDLLKQQDSEIVGITEYDNKKWGKNIYDIPVLGNDEIILSYEQDDISLVNGIGSIGDVNKRKQIYEYFVAKGYHFPRIVHISSVVSSLANLADGVQVLAGVVVNAGVNIGENSIINTNASIDHDVSIGSHVHIAPGVTISGGATIGDCTHIGTGATVIQGVHIGSNVLIGAGAVVVKDIPDNCKAYGVPAREV